MAELNNQSNAALATRLKALERAVDSGRAMLPAAVIERTATVRENARDRLARGDAAVVVALAGGTGSGKSTLFNALADDDIADAGVRRPTTTDPVALVVGDIEGAAGLLDWLEVNKRHPADAGVGLETGLILLDLPDHDSIRIDHKETVDRLVQRVDVLLWVLDPQKYAQGILHRGYLKDLRQHAEVQLVALNKIDELVPEERDACVADLKRILASEGLGKVGVFPISATEGTGLGKLRNALSALANRRTAAVQRIDGDLRKAADDLAAHIGLPHDTPLDQGPIVEVIGAAARVDDRAAFEAERYRIAAKQATRPPVVRALGAIIPGRGGTTSRVDDDFDPEGRDPSPVAVQHAMQELSTQYGRGLTRPWRSQLRDVAMAAADPLQRRTSAALARVTATPPQRAWWRTLSLVWGLFELLTLVGALWLLVAVASDYLGLPGAELPQVAGLPVPAWLLIVGLAGWIACRIGRDRAVDNGAKAHAQRVRKQYHQEIAKAVDETIAPVRREITTYQRLVADLRTVVGTEPGHTIKLDDDARQPQTAATSV